MRGRRRRLTALVACLSPMLLAGCGSTGITAGSLEHSIAPTFGRLYVRQQVEVGNPRPMLQDIRAHAHCVKGTRSEPQRGAGSDWVCYVTYLAAGPGTPVVATYDVTVQTDGCYAADGDGPVALNGRQTITAVGYRQIRNPLWLLNGCFDVG